MTSSSKFKGRVLTIARSDSGGGAGIQADIKTISALGGYAMTAVTALTAQDTAGVAGILAIDPDFVTLQARMAIEDIGVDVIKLGMLPDTGVMRAIGELVTAYPDLPVVSDPVMIASSGDALTDDEAPAIWKGLLIRHTAVLTPNIPEAEALTGRPLKEVQDLVDAGAELVAMGAGAVLVKGGHLPGDNLFDVLVTPDETRIFESPRISSANTHGTGCTLAAAIATELAFGKSLKEAVPKARNFVQEAMRAAIYTGRGHGPLNHQYRVRRET